MAERKPERKPDRGHFHLTPDREGAVWDLLLYVSTVAALATLGVWLWFGGEHAYAYVMSFLASLFFFIGANRILKTRLIVLASAPQAFDVAEEGMSIRLRGGTQVDLVKEIKVYADFAGRSFGVSGLDRQGRRLQFVFHRGQFVPRSSFGAAQEALRRLEKPRPSR